MMVSLGCYSRQSGGLAQRPESFALFSQLFPLKRELGRANEKNRQENAALSPPQMPPRISRRRNLKPPSHSAYFGLG